MDSTVIQEEGIDVLAGFSGAAEAVADLTNRFVSTVESNHRDAKIACDRSDRYPAIKCSHYTGTVRVPSLVGGPSIMRGPSIMGGPNIVRRRSILWLCEAGDPPHYATTPTSCIHFFSLTSSAKCVR